MAWNPILTGLAALAFALIHVMGPHFGRPRRVPRNAWLSLAGGVAVAYVFAQLLPELAAHQRTIASSVHVERGWLGAIEAHAYLAALAGLAIFYGLERLARQSALAEQRAGRRQCTSDAAFRIHLGAFAVYNLLIGYLLVHREESGLRGLVTYAVALGLHLVVNDQGLREHHGRAYDASGRWLLAAAPLAGWALGLATKVAPLLVAVLFAFLAGGIILNVLKEELPEQRESRFPAFAAGVTAYAALILATG